MSVIDVETMESRDVARDAIYQKHGGSFCLWHPNAHRIYYRQSEEHFARLDLTTGETDRRGGVAAYPVECID